ncbi:dirigent protein 19-like [Rutidosis leptorrhynchoides]|uniref:dirigent protein 19-like n=1 Tax=Rutidosis leptorrhynchoides TaxID=125765 RepID=UPI003A998588
MGKKIERLTSLNDFGPPCWRGIAIGGRNHAGEESQGLREEVGDVPMTVTPDPHSKEIARLQGTFVGVSRSDPNNTRSYMSHISFIRGKYKGSSLSIFGISNYFDPVRERPIVGGNRKLRVASGYIEARDISDNPNVEEYHICCLHYAP